jgi:GAF domain-containing protein
MAPIRGDILRSSAATIAVGLLAIYFGLWIGRGMVRPITILAGKARAIAKGSFEEDVGSIRTGDEIEDLAQSFTVMQVNLRDYVRELSGIVEAGERMNLALNVPFVENAIIKALRDYFGAEAVWIAFYNEYERQLEIEHFWSLVRGVDFSGLRLLPGQGVAGRVLMTGKPDIVRDIESSEFTYKDLAMRASIDSAITLPLVSGGGTIGVIGLYTPLIRQDRITEKEMSLLMALANQAAVAIENARLYEEARQSESKLKATNYELRILNKLALDISSGLDLTELLEKAVKNAMDLVETDIGSIGLYDAESAKLEFRYKASASQSLATHDLPGDLGLVETVVKTRGTILTNDYQHDPRAFSDALAMGINAVAVIPLFIGNRLIGVIQVASASGKTFSCGNIALLEAVGSQVAVAIENAKLYERERDIAEALQNALLAVPDKLAGVRFGLLYRAATDKSKVGGDFYDFIEFTNGMIGVVIGDVSGKGLEAATATALAKMTIRAFAYEYESPAEVLAHANSVLTSQMAPGQFITIAYLIIDPATGTLTYASAGHPMPVIADQAASSVRQLFIGSTPLGAIEGAKYEKHSDTLSEGEVVLLYTDGLLEARNNGTLFGEDGISRALLAIDDVDITEIPGRLLNAAQEFAHGKLNDDIAIVALSLDRGGEGQTPEKDTGHISDWII